MSTHRYYERSNNPQHLMIPAPRHTREDDYGVIFGFVTIAAVAFIGGMVLAAAVAGVL